MSSQIEDIKSRIDIVELISSYLRLQKAGSNFKANCPFHHEKTPSFNVSPARQIWHCFGCTKGGDVIQFVMDIEGIEFYDALKILAERAGIQLKSENLTERNERSRAFLLLEEATKFFESKLGAEPLTYLRSRGLTDATIKDFRLGFVPAEWRTVSMHLREKGFSVGEIEQSGLVVAQQASSRVAQGQNYYDRFRGRIMFPIFDYGGRVVAFGGRIFPENPNEAKYINSPETALYQKSKILYALNKSKTEILRANECIIVEGYMDAIMSYQAGVQNVVASSGTALTQDQLKILKRISEKMIAAFDMDLAGESAAKRGIELAMAEGFAVRVAGLEGVKDPADAVLKDPNLWKNAVTNARHIVQFYIDSALKKHSPDLPEAKVEFQKTVLPVVASLSSDLERAHWIKEIGDTLNIKEEIIWNTLKISKTQTNVALNEGLSQKQMPKNRRTLLEERIIGIVYKYPALSGKLDPELANIVPEGATAAFFAELLLNDITEAEVELVACEKELKKERLRERMSEISRQISILEKKGESNLDGLVEEFQTLSQRFSQL